ncbi:hypothetical protein ACMD2_26368 [Ananas comosus]|uniref:Neprosin PEP catalytic domain-containing protein n=1 Tax=Ananas comosus TaxID=4615 RepID=A0A199V287_ANACO|nr:hypothetical protein ACMD2_26368 [Ananas comosus]
MASKLSHVLRFLLICFLTVGENVNGRELLKPFDPSIHKIQWAAYETELSGLYYGSRAKINVWNLPSDIKPSHLSGSIIWVVYPDLYHDNKLHFFTYWTRDDYNSTGCYNLDCEGFVMVNWDILTPGSVVNPVSIYDGQQYYITLSIKKDAKSGDWFLYREDIGDAKLIGYWPKSLFTTLADSANKISWGGVVIYDKNDTGPPMGSGHYASELERKAAYFKNLEMFDYDGNSHDLLDGAQARYNDKEACYTLSALVNSGKFGLHDGHLFYFGGPVVVKDARG